MGWSKLYDRNFEFNGPWAAFQPGGFGGFGGFGFGFQGLGFIGFRFWGLGPFNRGFWEVLAGLGLRV